jgi:hypothetical protein
MFIEDKANKSRPWENGQVSPMSVFIEFVIIMLRMLNDRDGIDLLAYR